MRKAGNRTLSRCAVLGAAVRVCAVRQWRREAGPRGKVAAAAVIGRWLDASRSGTPPPDPAANGAAADAARRRPDPSRRPTVVARRSSRRRRPTTGTPSPPSSFPPTAPHRRPAAPPPALLLRHHARRRLLLLLLLLLLYSYSVPLFFFSSHSVSPYRLFCSLFSLLFFFSIRPPHPCRSVPSAAAALETVVDARLGSLHSTPRPRSRRTVANDRLFFSPRARETHLRKYFTRPCT